jgi:hypothetical protein
LSVPKSDPRAKIFGQIAHRDPQAGFSFWRPRNWTRQDIQDLNTLGQRELEESAVVYYPEDDPRTGFYALVRDLGPELGQPITAADLPDLRAGLLEGLQSLPEFHLLSEIEIGRESALGLEFTFTFSLDGQPCKRCMRFLYRGYEQFTLYGQGVPPAEYEVFANVFDWMYLTFTFSDLLEKLDALHTIPAPDQ